MIKRVITLIFLSEVLLCCHWANAVSIDGRPDNSSYYKATSYAFANGDFARGWVRLNDGFSVPAAGTVSLNLYVPVVGQINLNGTGTITLEGDLPLATGASFNASGGIIDGQGKALVLGGNMTLAAGAVLEFASNTIIEGNNHELILTNGTPGAQLYINGAAGTTVTIRNLTISGVRDYGTVPAIRFGTNANQTLVLENVMINLGGDYTYSGGKLTIKGTTAIIGEHIFDYQASYNCTISSHATFFLDLFSTFKYEPSDNGNTHLVFANATSRLFLNGGILFVPKIVGLKLLTGQLLVDNTAILQSDGATYGEGIIQIGDTGAEFTVNIFPGAQLKVVDGYVKYRNQN